VRKGEKREGKGEKKWRQDGTDRYSPKKSQWDQKKFVFGVYRRSEGHSEYPGRDLRTFLVTHMLRRGNRVIQMGKKERKQQTLFLKRMAQTLSETEQGEDVREEKIGV